MNHSGITTEELEKIRDGYEAIAMSRAPYAVRERNSKLRDMVQELINWRLGGNYC